MDSKMLTAIVLMISTMAGAAVLGLPYVFAQAGFLTGVAILIVVGIATTLMTLYVAELSSMEKTTHLLSGFAKHYFGKRGKYFTLIIETFGIYTALIAYLIAIGLALSNIFGLSPLIMGSSFFVVAASLILFKFKRFNNLDVGVAVVKMILLIFFIGVFFFGVKPENVTVFNVSKIFAPFGIVLFACLSYNVIPQMKKVLGKGEKKILPAIAIAMTIIFTLYIMFAFVFVGNFGTEIGEVAVVGLPNYTLLGNLFVLIAMAVPFIALTDAVKHVYVEDMGVDTRISWFLSAFIPFLIYVYVKLGFVTFLQISGTYAGGLLGLLTMFMILKARTSRKKAKFIVPGGNLPIYFSIAVFFIGIVYQTLSIFI